MSKISKKELSDMLQGFVESLEKEDMEDVSQNFPEELLAEYKKAFDEGKDIYSHLISSRENGILMNVMDKEDLSNRELKIFYNLYGFIRNHITSIIEMKEGHACSADKAGWVLANLEYHLKTGKKKEPDYSQKYTYHLPKVILNDTDTIYNFFKSLIALYHGNNQQYFLMYNQFIIK